MTQRELNYARTLWHALRPTMALLTSATEGCRDTRGNESPHASERLQAVSVQLAVIARWAEENMPGVESGKQ